MIKLIFVILSSFLFVLNVDAYTAQDIISLTNSVSVCDGKTSNIVSGMRKSYTILLNEREISEEDLNVIYSNVSKVITIVNKYKVCKLSDKDKIPSDEFAKLYSLYKEINDIFVKAPIKGITTTTSKVNSNVNGNSGNNNVVNNDNSSNNNVVNNNSSNNIDNNGYIDNESVIKYDSDNKVLEIKDKEGTLNVAVSLKSKLNYVGLNKFVKYSIIFTFIIILILLFIRKNFIIDCLLITFLIIFIPLFIFRGKISNYIDVFSMLEVRDDSKLKDAYVKDRKIISYPSYKYNYAKIYIGDDSEDVYYGDTVYLLKKGIGQDLNSSLPGEGKVILSGHNNGFFNKLFDVEKNDVFVIETTYGKFSYKYKSKKIVNDTDLSILDKDYDLILYTCYPDDAIYGNKRLVVMAKLDSEEWY